MTKLGLGGQGPQSTCLYLLNMIIDIERLYIYIYIYIDTHTHTMEIDCVFKTRRRCFEIATHGMPFQNR